MIVKTVATLIKSKTKAQKFNVEEYQSKDYLEQHSLTPSPLRMC